VKVVPLLLTVYSKDPPFTSANLLEIGSPNPVPFFLDVLKGVKGWMLSGIL